MKILIKEHGSRPELTGRKLTDKTVRIIDLTAESKKPPQNRFSRNKASLSESWFLKYNHLVFEGLSEIHCISCILLFGYYVGKLPADLSVMWNKRLLTTAGITKLQQKSTGQKEAKIELSEKVIDCEERLRSTLLHEM